MNRVLTVAFVLLAASTASANGYEEHDYILNCSGCHRMDGTGSSAVPSLHAMKVLARKPGARAYWIRVPGVAQAPLTDARLAALMSWLVKRFTGKPPTPIYTSEEVRRLRRDPLRDPVTRRSQILTGR